MGEPKHTIQSAPQPEPGISTPAPGFVFEAEQAGITGIKKLFSIKRAKRPAAQFIRAYSQVLSGIPDFKSRSRIHLYMIQAMANSLDPQAREVFLDLARRLASDFQLL
ncbi:hypothetical protein Dalk_0274 [Desulfatibacillum aliphaticivorans]|uniref:Uncharacterized protein n=1 Tax=Desulfatibacillum aliphaticivorans TaxID=218208 RepID=B8F8V1_DESAL|nr:hypothetical protein [Desulfatibacillum aliphaticivorans]ACL01983.1 hypothetical protein Dalk_0274 [Desulfatibacillum aliphaticivorans]